MVSKCDPQYHLQECEWRWNDEEIEIKYGMIKVNAPVNGKRFDSKIIFEICGLRSAISDVSCRWVTEGSVETIVTINRFSYCKIESLWYIGNSWVMMSGKWCKNKSGSAGTCGPRCASTVPSTATSSVGSTIRASCTTVETTNRTSIRSSVWRCKTKWTDSNKISAIRWWSPGIDWGFRCCGSMGCKCWCSGTFIISDKCSILIIISVSSTTASNEYTTVETLRGIPQTGD